MEKGGGSVFSAIENKNIAPLNPPTTVDIVVKEATTKTLIVGANTPGNVTRGRERSEE